MSQETLTEEEIERRRGEQIEAAMAEQGVKPTEEVYEDYFGFDQEERITLPDGVSYLVFRVMTEGDRRKYLNAQNRKVTIRKGTGDAEMQLAAGDDKYNLLKLTIVDWNLRRQGQPVPFSKRALEDWLNNANPRIVDLVHKEVLKAHPWMLADMTVEDIDTEIRNLQEMREIVLKEQEGN